MNKQDIVIFGTSKIAEIVFDCLRNDEATNLNPVAFCVDEEFYQENEKFGLPVVRFEEVEKFYNPKKVAMLVAIGYHGMNSIRTKKCQAVVEKGYRLATYIHSNVELPSSVSVGVNSIILNDVSIGSFAQIGNNVCIFSNAVVAHHVTVQDNVWITSGTVVGGNTTIGMNCFLGINSTIAHNVTIGNCNFIGTNAILTKDTEDNAVYIVPDTPKYRLNTEQFMRMFKFD